MLDPVDLHPALEADAHSTDWTSWHMADRLAESGRSSVEHSGRNACAGLDRDRMPIDEDVNQFSHGGRRLQGRRVRDQSLG